MKLAFIEYRDTRGQTITPPVRALLNCVSTVPVSTAECERGFSNMNVICSSLQTRLTVPDISSLTCISLCGPPIHLWLKTGELLTVPSVRSAQWWQTHLVQQRGQGDVLSCRLWPGVVQVEV